MKVQTGTRLDQAWTFVTNDKPDNWGQLQGVIFWILLATWTYSNIIVRSWRHVRAKGIVGTFRGMYKAVEGFAIKLILSLPSSKRKLNQEMGDLRTKFRKSIDPAHYPNGVKLRSGRELPKHGRSLEWLQEEWRGLKGIEKTDVDEGKVSGTVYHGGEDVNQVISEAMSQFLLANPLHSSVFPAIRKMESEIVSMCLSLFNHPDGAGTTTSGGTESILMAVKTYRDWAKATKGITHPEMIVPESAHAAFWKAAHYLGIKIHSIPVNKKSRKADVAWMGRAINPNTIMIVGSAPNFPDGAIDPIPALARLAKRHNIGLHVDSCLGSFIMPFLDRAGFGEEVEPFDFRNEGVTSMSCDIHKYAFCPKGASVIMYRSAELRRYQYFIMADWAGGLYPSPSMAGSRPGMILAGAWAVMNYIGTDGYTESCRQIVSAARHLKSAIQTRFASDLYVLGDPLASVVAFGSHKLSIYALADMMTERGWHLNALANPPAVHMAFTLPTSKTVDRLLDDLEYCVAQLKKEPKGSSGDMVALYGIGQTSVGPHVVEELAKTYIDVLYE
ncbi:putative sphinganine-1-phosphate aldolase [Kockovaella imperatae]|uniref:sphinganine-1-phosphate aldolase n=1 Tax=Kockovaella imperatae TaxID=4999 RepID=A0A1Y1UBB0_9TREE|nr:putative sphinganine-1-phosphate aldolase [Kockovaella imperatae]ORX35330.1 putative sphinganine-1-phosphate aldolase [Kockovaella imperatae]